jgi:ubiquinone/menaquinone biosynthesis C-methylase UbiE
MTNTLDNKEFFNLIATDYDEMVSFKQSVEKKKEAFKSIIQPWMKTAADLGCGTGADSISLASSGLQVTAFDPSPEMIKAAEENAKKENLKINFHTSPVHSIPESFNNQFDIVVSLGNTFANIEQKHFGESIEKCFELLKNRGQLVIQVLNYEKILSEKKRIVNIREGKENYFIRFYDFNDDEIIFNILIFNKTNPKQSKLFSTNIYPYTTEDFSRELSNTGFNKTEFYADLNFTKFDILHSQDLFIIGEKS